MSLEQDNVDRICRLVVDHDLSTKYVAERFDISRRRVQQLAKEYRETGVIPTLQSPGRNPYAEYPNNLVKQVLELYQVHARAQVFLALCLRLVVAITNYERGDNPGSTIIRV